MSIDQYQFQMIHRMEEMTRQERIAADEQAGRIAQALFGLGQALVSVVRRRHVAQPGGATMRLRRSA